MVKLILFLLTLLIFVSNSYATTYYVCDTGTTCGSGWVTGSDSNNGTAKATPYKTIQKAADVVNAGDTVIVGDGTYSNYNTRGGFPVNVYINRAGTSGSWITFRAENKWGAKINGGGHVQMCVLIDYQGPAAYIRMEDFEIYNCYQTDTTPPDGDGIFINAADPFPNCPNAAAHDIYFKGLKIHDICYIANNRDSGITAIDGDPCTGPITVDSCLFYNVGRLNYYTTPQAVPGGTLAANEATCTGYTYEGGGPYNFCYNHDAGVYTRGSDVTVINSIFYDFKSGWAIQPLALWENISDLKIVNNTFYGFNAQRDYHILIADGYGWTFNNVLIQNNIFHSPRNYAINMQSNATNVTVTNNLVYGASLVGGTGCADPDYTCSNNISGQDPLFVDLINRNFHINASSPAKDTGLEDSNTPALDYDGQARPQNSLTDIGADEVLSTDVTAPVLPGDTTITPTVVSCSRIDLDWTASTDETEMGYYSIERCAGAACSSWVEVGTSPTSMVSDGSSWSDYPLTESTLYRYRVRPRDAAGNWGSYYTIAEATTLSCSSCSTYTVKKSTQIVYLTQNNCTDFSEANSLTVGNMSWKAKYDCAGFYVCASVTDTELNYAEYSRDDELWLGDSVKLSIDWENNGGGSEDANDYKFFVNIGNIVRDTKQALTTWNPIWTSNAIATGTINSNSDSDTGFVIKMIIPWTAWGVSVPTSLQSVGFDISVYDTDSGVQGSETYYCNSNGGSSADPNGWADAIFEANNYSSIATGGTGTLGAGGTMTLGAQ